MAIGSPQWMYKSGEAYTIDQSLRFDNDQRLTRTPASAGNRKTFTFSAWVKFTTPDKSTRNQIFCAGTAGAANDSILVLNGSDNFAYLGDAAGDGSWTLIMKTDALVRDPSAWYHIVYSIDTTQSTASNRGKIYINGNLASLSDYTAPSQNADLNFNNTIQHWIGDGADTNGDFDGYITEVNFIDGQALTPADFGETGDYGEWKPIEYSGTYGTNGFYLPFKQDYTVEGFSTVLSTGNATNKYVGGTGFKPSLVWNKTRSANQNHFLYDRIRGAGNELRSNLTNAEGTNDGVLAFKPDGFTRGSSNDCNENGITYVDWCWDMGADTPTGFGCVKYSGSSSDLSVGGMNFSPDLVWIKRRNGIAEHFLIDSVRGNRRILNPDGTNAELDRSYFKSFDPDGFSVESGVSNSNNNGDTYVAWGWDMGGTSVANTTGDINSTVMANTTYGQSIVSWTGTGSGSSPTVGHGLSSTPEFIVVKHTDAVGVWAAQHKFDTTKYLQMQDVDAATTAATVFDNTAPTSSVFTINATNAVTNQSGGDYIAYCFHSVAGYSKIDSFSGSGVSGNTITTGFRPALLIVKQTNAAGENWYMFDSTREPLGELDTAIKLDETGAEATSSTKKVEFTDTGFKLNSTNSALNASGSTYIYLAFAGGIDSISDYNTDGSIDSRVKANPTYGQSIVKYPTDSAEQTVGHGLSSAPEVVITKALGATGSWDTWFTGFSEYQAVVLNSTAAKYTNSGAKTVTSTSSSTVGFGLQMIGSNYYGVGNEMIAYCFHSVTGYSKFGSFTGNGGSQTITTGFRPAFLLLKRSSNSSGWFILDNTRSPSNPAKKNLSPNTSGVESTASGGINFTDTGFQESGFINDNGQTVIYMAFADKREYAYWLDQSGNNNDWTSNNLTESDISVDSPTNNFCTWNPLDKGDQVTVAEGNTQLTFSGTAGHSIRSTFSMSSGKWYCEIYVGDNSSLGIIKQNAKIVPSSGSLWPGANGFGSGGSYAYAPDGRIVTNSSYSSYGTNPVAGDILGIAFDSDNGKIYFSLNGVWQNSSNPESATNPAYTGISGTFAFAAGYWTTPGSNKVILNCGQDSSFAGNKTAQGNQDSNEIGDFYYTPPTGFLALCTSNLPDVAVTPSEHFNTVLYTGTGSSQSITGVGFQPDFVWAKKRSEQGWHHLYDAIRGTTKVLYSNVTDAENTSTTNLTSFDVDGFSLGGAGGLGGDSPPVNAVAWNWKANGSGSSNTNGSITSTVSANVDAGFSIVSYNGGSAGTVGHGLSKTPELIIQRSRNIAEYWWTGTTVIDGSMDFLRLNDINAKSDSGYSVPTSTVFSNVVYTGSTGNIAYCFHSVDGYSKVGTYTGNGNADGPFVYTGFRPAFVMVKSSSMSNSETNWVIWDNKRNGYNDNVQVFANQSWAEGQRDDNAGAGIAELDILSNGFKHRDATWAQNGQSGATFIYLCFAETPFKYSNAR